MRPLTITLRTVTPLFLGGAEPNDQAELRVASLKGLLRYWYRACDPEYRKWEPRIFGGTGCDEGQACASLRLAAPIVGHEPWAGAAAWRFVSGLGIAHPFETGFVFDRLHGVPFLPGSSVKGAARAWAEQACEDAGTRWSGKTAAAVEAVFGPELNDEGDKSRREPARGAVVFFDAYPTAAPRGQQDADGWPALEVDLLNPHYKDYYEGQAPPADYLSPVPIFFLTVAPRQCFEFVVAVRSETGDEWQATLARAGVDSAEKLAQLALAAVRRSTPRAGTPWLHGASTRP